MILILAVCETCRNTQEIYHLDFSSVGCSSCGGDIENDTVINKAFLESNEPTTLQKLSIMKRNVKDLQEGLTNAHKRIKYLNDLVKP
jgi:hypothetical protein